MAHIPLPITALYAGMLGLLLVALSLMVIRQRYRARVGLYDGGDEVLGRAIRVHGNLCEYLPPALILLAVIEINGAPDWALHGVGLVLVVVRLFHAYGLWQSSGPSTARFIGMVGTFSVIITAAVYAIVQYIGSVQAI